MSVNRLPVIGVTEYNGYEFPDNTDTTAYKVRPLRDPSNRTIWACEFSISLHWFDSDPEGRGGSLNSRMADAVALLTKNAGVLKYRGRGFGTPPAVNEGRTRDVAWGPTPGDLDMKVHGGATVECNWSVTFTLPTCDDAVYFGLAWFAFTLAFDRDKEGYQTRTYDAKLRIAQTKTDVAGRSIPDSADNYLSVMVPALLDGFRRERVNRRLTEDKSEMSLTVVDTQMPPNKPPAGVIEAEASHVYRSETAVKFLSAVSATYDIPPGGDVGFATLAFLNLANDRFAKSRGAPPPPGVLAAAVAAGVPLKRECIVREASVEEPRIYGRTQAKFSLSYHVIGAAFPQIIQFGGLWTPLNPVASASWKDWSASIPTVLSPRGHANLVFTPGEDKILDLCRAGSPTTPTGSVGASALGGILTAAAGAVSGATAAAIAAAVARLFTRPTPDASWVEYKVSATVSAEPGRIPITTLPTAALSSTPPNGDQANWDVYNGALPSGATGTPGLFPARALGVGNVNAQQSGTTEVQQRQKPTLYLTVRGTALRAYYEVPVPEVVSINGRKPVLVGQPRFGQWYEPNSLTPLVRAVWELVYVFTDSGGTPTASVGPVPTTLY